MSIANLLLGIYLVLVGAVQLFNIDIDPKIVGLVALIAGIVVLLEGVGLWRRT